MSSARQVSASASSSKSSISTSGSEATRRSVGSSARQSAQPGDVKTAIASGAVRSNRSIRSSRLPSSGPSSSSDSADWGAIATRSSPSSRARASTATARAATATSATPRPIPSQLSVESRVSGKTGSIASAAASAAVRATAGQPIRDRPPKHPQGAPAPPHAIATTSATAKSPSSAAAASAAPGTPTASTAPSTASTAIVAAQSAVRARDEPIPYERSASRARAPASSFVRAAPISTAARQKRRRPTTVKDRWRIPPKEVCVRDPALVRDLVHLRPHRRPRGADLRPGQLVGGDAPAGNRRRPGQARRPDPEALGLTPAADRAAFEEELDPVGRPAQVVLGDELRLPGGHHAVPGDRPYQCAHPVGEIPDLRASPEGLEVDVAQAPQLRPTRLEVEPPGDRAQRHREREQRVRDAAVAPVEDDIPAVADEDLPVVEVVADGLSAPVRYGGVPASAVSASAAYRLLARCQGCGTREEVGQDESASRVRTRADSSTSASLSVASVRRRRAFAPPRALGG